MAEAIEIDSGEAGPTAEERKLARDLDRANVKTVGVLHFVMAMGALTLWGAADAWAVSSGWLLAWTVALANAVIAGVVLANIVHEWGHFAGARLAGAVSPARAKPVSYFFMFDFSFEKNDTRQFLWMSWGGILAPWLLVLDTSIFVPIDNASRAMLLAVLVARAVQIAVFEVPVALRTAQGSDPRTELGSQLKSGFAASRWIGLAVGAVVFLAA